MDPKLKKYIEDCILPTYNHYDKGHDQNHILKVIDNSLEIAKDYDVDIDVVYVIAAFHDLGMPFGRKDHHLSSAILAYYDHVLNDYYTPAQLLIIKEAIEDHRASSTIPPRTIYGKIIAEADRDINPDRIIYRTHQFTLDHYPYLDPHQQFLRSYQHLVEKYGVGGYLKLYLDTAKNNAGLTILRALIKDKDLFEEKYQRIIANASSIDD